MVTKQGRKINQSDCLQSNKQSNDNRPSTVNPEPDALKIRHPHGAIGAGTGRSRLARLRLLGSRKVSRRIRLSTRRRSSPGWLGGGGCGDCPGSSSSGNSTLARGNGTPSNGIPDCGIRSSNTARARGPGGLVAGSPGGSFRKAEAGYPGTCTRLPLVPPSSDRVREGHTALGCTT